MSILSPRQESQRKVPLPILTRAKEKPTDPNKDLSVYINKNYKKTIPKRSNKGLGSFQDGSLKKLKSFMLDREKGWDQRFVLQQIPDILQKNKQFLVRKRKSQRNKSNSRAMNTEMVGDSEGNVQANLLSQHRKYSSQYNLKKRASNQQQNPSNQQNQQNQQNQKKSSNGQQSHRRLINNQRKKQCILALLQSFSQYSTIKSQAIFLNNLSQQLQIQEDNYFSGLAIRQFKYLVECIDKANQSVSKRQLKLTQTLRQTKNQVEQFAKSQTKQEKQKIKQQLLPLLLDLSIVTLEVVQSITAFKATAQQICQKHELTSLSQADISFYMETDYSKKILQDTKQIYQSGMFKGVSYPDPFFLSYPINHVFQQRDLMYKIRASQLMLLEQALNC